jgi:hypothetical protein
MTKLRTAEALNKRLKEIDISSDEESKKNTEEYFAVF